MTDDTNDRTTLVSDHRGLPGRRPRPTALGLAVLWSRTEPERTGEVALPDAPDAPEAWFGRGPRAGAARLTFARQRPGSTLRTGLPRSQGISREQWRVRRDGDVLEVENVGRRDLLHDGARTPVARARAGDRLEIADELLVLVVERPLELPSMRLPPSLVPDFGRADAFGIVGESPAAWELRRQLAFAAGREDHVLLTGPSGSGKELASRTLHSLSRRGGGRMVARNAATLPESLIDAELFGNPRDYPNPGMPERPGLIGAADGSTLFLDEIGELSHALQAHLLRVIEGGEYQRLGEARARHADVRVVAATNRDPLALKHDLLGRLRLRVQVPGLDRRREDIPLIAAHVLRGLAAGDPLVAERAFPDGDLARPCWSPGLVGALTAATYDTHVRELATRLWEAIARSDGGGLTSSAAIQLAPLAAAVPASDDTDGGGGVDPLSLTPDQVRAALEACGGSRDRTWRALGLRSRHQLVRLMRRHGLAREPGPGLAGPDAPTAGQGASTRSW